MLESEVPEDHIIEIPFDCFENKKLRDPEVLYPHIKAQLTDDQQYYILLDETYINDIVGRHRIRNTDEFEELINILSFGIGSLTNPKKLADTFKTKRESG